MTLFSTRARLYRTHSRRDWFIPFCLIVFLALVGYGFLLRPGRVLYSPFSDIVSYHLATKEVLFRSIHTGRGIPFWRADQLAGGPAFISPNALYTNPLHFLFYLFPPAEAMGWTIWLHLLIGAWSYYLLGGVLGLSRWPRLVMATAGLFNFKLLMALYAGWLSMLPSLALLPLLFAAIFQLAKRPVAGSALALAAIGALGLHAGHLQLFYYSGWFLAAYLLVTQIGSWREGRRREVRQVAVWLCWSGLLGIGMAAYLLLPLAAEAPLMSRSLASEEYLRHGHSLGIGHLLTFFHPEALGTPVDGTYPAVELWEDVAYFGLLPLLLAAVGAAFGWRRSPARFLVGAFAFSVLAALDTPVQRFLYAFLPGFRLFRLPGRLLFLTAFFGITLAGIGFEEFLARVRKRGCRAWWPHLIAAAVVLVIAAEGAGYARRYLEMVEGSQILPSTSYARLLGSDPSLFRVAPVGRGTINYGWAAAMRLQLITGYEPFNLWHFFQYAQLLQLGEIRSRDDLTVLHFVRVARADLLDALNVKYLLSAVPLALPPDRFELLAHYTDQPSFDIYRGMTRTDVFVYLNTKVLPRAFWVDRVVPVRTEAEAIAEMQRNTLWNLAVVQGVAEGGPSPPGSPEDRATVMGAADGYLAVGTDTHASRFLVISEIWHPGWRARMDGREITLRRVDLAFMGAWIPAGRHRLVLEFRPLYWRAGLSVSVFFGSVFLGWLVIHLIRIRRRPESRA